MQLWLVLFGSVLALAVIALLARVRLELELQARGEPTGAWVAAFGAAFGPLAFASVAARGAALRVEVFLFGRRLKHPWPGRRRPKAPKPRREREERDEAARPDPRGAPLETALERVRAHGRLLGRLERHVRPEALEVDVVYGFRDVALTGRLVAAFSILSGVLGRSVKLTHTPLWDGVERWQIQARGRVGLWLGLVAAELLWYTLRRWLGRSSTSTRGPQLAPRAAAPPP